MTHAPLGSFCLGFFFFVGHLWHAGRTLYRDLLSGIALNTEGITFGEFGKVGDVTSGINA